MLAVMTLHVKETFGDWLPAQTLVPVPRLALDGGDDGLEAYRRIAVQAVQVLSPEGWLLVEVGIGQATVVNALFKAAGLSDVLQRDDYAGIPRVVMGKKRLEAARV